MASTATALMQAPDVLAAARTVHDERQARTPYQCPIPQDVKPPILPRPE